MGIDEFFGEGLVGLRRAWCCGVRRTLAARGAGRDCPNELPRALLPDVSASMHVDRAAAMPKPVNKKPGRVSRKH